MPMSKIVIHNGRDTPRLLRIDPIERQFWIPPGESLHVSTADTQGDPSFLIVDSSEDLELSLTDASAYWIDRYDEKGGFKQLEQGKVTWEHIEYPPETIAPDDTEI